MDFLRDTWLYAEAVLLPELATYETEVFAVTAVVGLLVLLGKYQKIVYSRLHCCTNKL